MSIPVTPSSARARLHALNEQLRTLGHLPEAVALIHREIGLHDGFPARGESAGRGSSELTPVEAAAANVEHLVGELRDMQDDLDTITLAVGLLVKKIRHRLPTAGQVVVDKTMCTVGAYHDEWAVPRSGDRVPCPDLAETYPSGNPRPEYLCEKHRKRRQRWLRDQEHRTQQGAMT